MSNPEMIKPEQLADYLGVKLSWVYGETRKTGPNAIPQIRVGKYIRFIREDVIAWLKAQDDAGVNHGPRADA